MAGKPIRIAILANGSKARSEFNQTASSASSMGSKIGKAAKAGAAALVAVAAMAGAAAVKLGMDSLKAASDAQQSLGATETVYGKYAKQVVKRSKEAATAIGVSANEYRELSNVTGALLTGAGMPLKKVAALTGNLNKRAADLAATFGGTTREAVEAISSLMKGEADPIERYGVSIKASDVAARMAAKGQDKLTGAAKKQAEMQARVDLLMQKTTKSSGAFAKESDTLAHKQQVLSAKFEDIKAAIGQRLLPVATKALDWVDKMAPSAKRLGQWIDQNVVPAFRRFAGEVGPSARGVMDSLKKAFKDAQPFIKLVGQAVKDVVIPVFTKLVKFNFKRIAIMIEALGTALGIVGRAGIRMWNSALQPAFKFMANAIGTILDKLARMIGALDLPGAPAWIGKTARALREAADDARDVADGIEKIPTHKTVTIAVKYAGLKDPSRGRDKGGPAVLPRAVLGAVTTTRAASSRVLEQLGQWMPTKIARGIYRGRTRLTKTLEATTAFITKHLDKKLDGKALRARTKGVLKSLRDEYVALKKNARAQDKVREKLKAAQAAYQAAKKARADYAAAVKSQMVEEGSVMSLGGDTGFGSLAQMLAQLRAKVDQAKTWAATIKRLTAAGLNKTTLQQLIAAGAEAGMGTAQAILSGGRAGISEINSLTSQLVGTATTLGNQTAQTMHGAGVQAAAGLVNGLKDKAKDLTKAATRLAQALVKAVKKALGIKSPSRVFKGLGDHVTAGLVIGLDEHRVRRQGAQLANALTKGFATPELEAGLRSRRSSGDTSGVTRVVFSADELARLQRGREVVLDIDTYGSYGGRRRA